MNLLVVAPHPDDESLGCGGSLCIQSDAGGRVTVVFLTSGEKGIPDAPADEARQVREAEAAAAAEILGVARLEFLRLPDAGLVGHVTSAAARLAIILCEERPDIVYAPHPSDNHDDHIAAYRAVCEALEGGDPEVRLRAYEVWTPLQSCDLVVDISSVVERKLAAVRCHRSQLAQYAFDRAVAGLNAYRGALMGGCAFAEGFLSLPSRR